MPLTFLLRAVSAAALCALASTASAQTAALDAGRLHASNCFQCHGTAGKISAGFGTLAGVPAKDMLAKLNDMRRKPARDSIMIPHARGYTNEQLTQIANYFASLPKP